MCSRAFSYPVHSFADELPSMKKSLLFLSLVLLNLGGRAQEERVTCHQLHSPIKPQPLTEEQKNLLNESNQRSDTFNILNYAIHIDVTDYFGEFIKAYTEIDVRPKMNDVTEINLDLFQLNVDSVHIDGVEAIYDYDGAILSVQLASPSVIDQDFQVTVWYNGNPHQDPQWGGFYFASNYIYNLGIGLSTIPPNFGKVWYPCFDTFVERATYDFYVLSDDGLIPRCQGELMSETQLEGDSILSYYRLAIPIPTYLSAIAAADYETISYDHVGAFGSIPVELQARSGLEGSMSDKFQNLGSAIDAMEYWYGPYIWNKVGYVMTTVGAMEHATNIAYPQSMMNATNISNEQLFSHELGHLWWGDIASPEIHNHMWLKEGHAEYSQHLMREWHSGHEDFIREVKDNQLFVLETAHVDDGGYFPLSPIPDEVIYGRHSYYKGAAQMHTLRGYVGDSLFRVGLQGVLDTFYLSHMNPEQYKSAFTNSTGFDISDWMEDNIYSPGFSTFVVDSMSTVPEGGGFNTTFHIHQKLREAPHYYTNVPLDFTFLDENWEKHSVNELVSGEFSTVSIYTDFEPQFAMLNGEARLNQAGLDYDDVLFEETNTVTLPWVKMKMKVLEISDTAYYYTRHHWVAPDNHLVDDEILQMSSTHYWTVGGIWSEGLSLNGRFNFLGVQDYYLDYDLVGETEDNIGLVHRVDASDPWSIYPWVTMQLGSNNGSGTIRVDSLISGDYAFANVESTVGILEYEEEVESRFHLYPNPVADLLYVSTEVPGPYQLKLYDLGGKLVWEENRFLDRKEFRGMDVKNLAPGNYELNISSENGRFTETLGVMKE